MADYHTYPTGLTAETFDTVVVLLAPLLDKETTRWKAVMRELGHDDFELNAGERGRCVPKPYITDVESVPRELVQGLLVRLPSTPVRILRFDVELRCRPDVTLDASPNLPSHLPSTLERSLAAESIQEWVEQLIFAANVAMPGALTMIGGLITSGKTLDAAMFRMSGSSFDQAEDTAERIGWPPVRTLTLAKTWAWLRAQSMDGTPKTKRAIAALRRLLTNDSNTAVDLLWAMVGIEALFVEGSNALLHQVRERSRLLLGDWQRAGKIVSKMYDLRSRFVHGDLDFTAVDEVDVNNLEREDLRWAADVAVAVLLASIQELVRRDWRGVRFATTCESA